MGTYSTIQAAVDASSEISFSHVELGDGVYRENVVVMTDSSSANGVSIQAAPGCSPVWRQATAFGPGPILTLDSSADLDGGDVLVDIRNIQFSTAEPDPTDPLGSLIWPTDGAAIVAEADSTGVLGGYETADFLIWIDDCEFLNCRAGQASSGESRDGGAIRVQGVELDIVNCRFDGCHATNAGSISASSSLVEIDNCDFTNGVASANGGVIQAVDCEIQIYESRLSANTAAYHGGAILVEGSSLDLAHCSLRNNAAFAGGGGAVYVREATVPPPYGFTPGSEISDCRFVDNSGPTQPHIMLEGMLEVRMYSTHICPQPSAPESWVTYTGYEPTVETVCADDIADINCDGASDAADLLLVLSHWGSRSHWALPDVTDDGQVDVYDLLQVLSGMASG
ncbi:MAG: hypothetical protein QF561_00770 [Phycisphaerales bacterium]|jgi:hypothetical protein|nr:hypothetical protein [Phycisphaerales bacterium]